MSTSSKIKKILLTLLGIVIAVYILFPFYLVVLNAFKKQSAIVANPISFAGASFSQMISNLHSVVNNSNFRFWSAFGSSVVITVCSLVLLAVLGSMAAWVISRNNRKKWAAAIYMVFIASMIIPFQVVMLPLISTFRDAGKFAGISLLQSIPGIIFAYLGFGGAMTVFILTGFIKGVPYDLEEAAAIDHLKRNVDLERLSPPLSDAGTQREDQDPARRRAGLRRILCQAVGPDPFGGSSGNCSHDRRLFDRPEADHEGHGRGSR